MDRHLLDTDNSWSLGKAIGAWMRASPGRASWLRDLQWRIGHERVTLWMIRSRMRRNWEVVAAGGLAVLGAILLAAGALRADQWEALGTWIAGLGTLVVSGLVLKLTRRMHTIEAERDMRERKEEWRQVRPVLVAAAINAHYGAYAPEVIVTVKNVGGETARDVTAALELVPPDRPSSAWGLTAHGSLADQPVDIRPGESAVFSTEHYLHTTQVTKIEHWWRYVGITVTTEDRTAEAWVYAKARVLWVEARWGIHEDRYGILGARPPGAKPWEVAGLSAILPLGPRENP